MARNNADAFSKQLRQWHTRTLRNVEDVFVFAIQEVRRSVIEGSTITGAPGQLVDEGTLKTSWQDVFTSKYVWELATVNKYARAAEDGGRLFRGKRIRYRPPGVGNRLKNGVDRKSKVGGFHSVKLTLASWDRVVTFAIQQAGGPRR